MTDKHIIIRADANHKIGTGHVMRCIALGQAWQKRGGRVLFVSCCNPSLKNKLTNAGFELLSLEKPHPDSSDLTLTLDALIRYKARIIVLDGYHFTDVYNKKIREKGFHILMVDDDNHLEFYNTDFLLNQNLDAEKIDYRCPANTVTLLGKRFTMLRKEFLKPGKTEKRIEDRAKHILVTMGGSDPDNTTLKVVKALNLTGITGFSVKIIAGPANNNTASIKKALEKSGFHHELIVSAEKMPDFMEWADMAVSAGGSTAWELCYMGVPAVYMVNAENQKGIVTAIEKAGAGLNAGWHSNAGVQELSEIIASFIENRDLRKTVSDNARGIIDGKGSRIIALILSRIHGNRHLNVSILSDKDSWINPFIREFKTYLSEQGHKTRHVHAAGDIEESDMLFCLGCGQMLPPDILRRNTHTLVVHESDLPHGKGWSPLTWQILEGQNSVPVTLFEAAESVDSGGIYLQEELHFTGFELVEELRKKQWEATFKLCRQFIEKYPETVAGARVHQGKETFYGKRAPEDSRLDPDKTIRQQFNLMRVADNERYPLFFELDGRRFTLKIESEKENESNENS